MSKITLKHCNVSHQDQIWKDYVKKEIALGKLWHRDWGFLPDQYQQMRKAALEAGVITRRSSNASSSTSPQKESSSSLKLPPLQAPPQDTSHPFPTVTSREVGWRTDQQRSLEMFGRWGRPKFSIVNQLKWPNDAVP